VTEAEVVPVQGAGRPPEVDQQPEEACKPRGVLLGLGPVEPVEGGVVAVGVVVTPLPHRGQGLTQLSTSGTENSANNRNVSTDNSGTNASIVARYQASSLKQSYRYVIDMLNE
jgi:hypothetical protein